MKIYMFSLSMRSLFTAHNEQEKQQAITYGFEEIPEYVHGRFMEAQLNGTLDWLIDSYYLRKDKQE